jgi:uncharacterized protein YbjT (DUF2867 family)
MIVITGATGQLGRLVVDELLKKVPAREIAVAVRNPDKATELAARGVAVRRAASPARDAERGAGRCRQGPAHLVERGRAAQGAAPGGD